MGSEKKLIEKLIDKKAEENNTIDLNAYALGLKDGIKNSKALEMLEMLKDIEYFGIGYPTSNQDYESIRALIKEIPEL